MSQPPPSHPHPPGDSREALNALSQRLYDDLRHLAAAQLKAERPDHTLQPTALVHEAYLRLSRQHAHIADRHQFIALVSGMMRRILVDHARTRQADKRGGHHTQVTLAEIESSDTAAARGPDVDLLALDSAMERLALIAPEQARIVELRFFGGLNVEETAALMNIGRRSVDREWAIAKAWLFRELAGGDRA